MRDYSATIDDIVAVRIEGRVKEVRTFQVIGVIVDCLAALGELFVRETDGLSREGRTVDPFTSTVLISGQLCQFPLV